MSPEVRMVWLGLVTDPLADGAVGEASVVPDRVVRPSKLVVSPRCARYFEITGFYVGARPQGPTLSAVPALCFHPDANLETMLDTIRTHELFRLEVRRVNHFWDHWFRIPWTRWVVHRPRLILWWRGRKPIRFNAALAGYTVRT